MEGSGETECSRTSPSGENGDEEEEGHEASNKASCRRVEETEKKTPQIRPYRLQMYRSKQIDEHSYQGNEFFLGTLEHHNMFNLRQLPLLPSFHQSQNYRPPINLDFRPWRKEEDMKEEFGLLHKQNSSYDDHVYFMTCSKLVQHRADDEQRTSLDGTSHFHLERSGVKRKASMLELDLNLSLGQESRIDVQQNSHNSVLIYKKLNARGASTLDLTL